MTRYDPGIVLLVDFPFPAQTATKRRPVFLMADVDHEDIIVAQVTSHPPRGRYDLHLAVERASGHLFHT